MTNGRENSGPAVIGTRTISGIHVRAIHIRAVYRFAYYYSLLSGRDTVVIKIKKKKKGGKSERAHAHKPARWINEIRFEPRR